MTLHARSTWGHLPRHVAPFHPGPGPSRVGGQQGRARGRPMPAGPSPCFTGGDPETRDEDGAGADDQTPVCPQDLEESKEGLTGGVKF